MCRNALEDAASHTYIPLPSGVQAPENNPEILLKLSSSFLYKSLKVKSPYSAALKVCV